jgi:hypothetical protein
VSCIDRPAHANQSIIPASSIMTYVCRPLTSCHNAFLHGAPRALLHHRRERISRLPPPTNPPPSSPLLRASLPCDGPILRPELGLLLSRACDSPISMSFGTSLASPLTLAARCHLLHVCAQTRQAPFKLAAACVDPYLHVAEFRMQSDPLYTSLLFAG